MSTNLHRVMPAPVLTKQGRPMSWEGKSKEELTEDEIADMCQLCDKEGWRHGYLDAKDGHLDPNRRNPFPGVPEWSVPNTIWAMAYSRGTRHAMEGKNVDNN